MKRWIHATTEDEYYSHFIDENDIPEAIQRFMSAENEQIDRPLVKEAVEAFFDELRKFPGGMEGLNMKYSRDEGRFYRKYRAFSDKCKEIAETINPSGYGKYDFLDLKMRDRLRSVPYYFPYGWKNH